MSSEVFENLEDDLKVLLSGIKQRLEVNLLKVYGEDRKRIIRDVERDFEDCLSMLEEMEVESRNAPLTFRNQMTSKVKYLRDEMNKLKQMLRKINSRDELSFTRQDLFAGDGTSNVDNQVRSTISQTNVILDRTTQSIARSTQVAIETEHIGHEIIGEMSEQRETLIRARDHLEGTDANLAQSRKILKSMYIKVMTNKLILAVIILLEIGILIGVVYWKFFR